MTREVSRRVIVWDAFSDADSSDLTSRPPLIAPAGASWEVSDFFTTGTASATLETGGLRLFTVEAGSGAAIVESRESDGVLTLKHVLNSINGARNGIAFRATSLTDFFLFRHNDPLNRLEYLRAGEGFSKFATLVSAPSDEIHLRVDLDGPLITCTGVDVTQGITAVITDNSQINENETLHGIHSRPTFGGGDADRLSDFLMTQGRAYSPRI